MKRVGMLLVVAAVVVGFSGWSGATEVTTTQAIDAVTHVDPILSAVPTPCDMSETLPMTEVKKGGNGGGKGKPKPGGCCDPALEPGANGNPFCFEGHSCCSDGRWRCNNPDATPSCTAGTVCSS